MLITWTTLTAVVLLQCADSLEPASWRRDSSVGESPRQLRRNLRSAEGSDGNDRRVGGYGESGKTDHNHEDPHGGVPMGIRLPHCDNGVDAIEIDWDPESEAEYTCYGPTLSPKQTEPQYYAEREAKQPLHKCYPDRISYSEPVPVSGAHRPLWPKYGEYFYVPPQRWLHNLEHGAVVFLYHPCANPSEIAMFKLLARNCLRKHIITPYKKVGHERPFVIATWKHRMSMSHFDIEAVETFVREHALKAPEGRLEKDGQYGVMLKQPAPAASYYKGGICSMQTQSTSEDRRQITDLLAKELERKVQALTKTFRSFEQQQKH